MGQVRELANVKEPGSTFKDKDGSNGVGARKKKENSNKEIWWETVRGFT